LMGAMGKGPLGKGADGMPLGGKGSPFDPPVVPDPNAVDGMPIKGGGQSPFDPGTDPEVSLDDEQRDADGKFSSGGRSDTEIGLTHREREDWGGRSGNSVRGGGGGGSGWSASELADYGDGALDAAEIEKRTKQFVADMGREPSEEERKRIAGGSILKPRGGADDAAWDAAIDIATDWALKMALDRESVRSIDHDGRMHIEVANICKANVCPYKGDEIPGHEELGLDPDRIYRLLRDPDELEKALPSANSLQILKRHVPVNADDHQPWETVGATGSTATWSTPCIQNSLVVWAKDAIDDIESGDKRELSPGYRYKPDMTPGSYQGEAYDGVMREIRFNHLALVETGRQGSDVVIGDNDDVLWGLAERAIMEYLQAP